MMVIVCVCVDSWSVRSTEQNYETSHDVYHEFIVSAQHVSGLNTFACCQAHNYNTCHYYYYNNNYYYISSRSRVV